MKKIFYLFLLLMPVFFTSAQTENRIEINPYIIDEQGLAGEIFEYNVELTNNTDRLVNLYAIVNDFNTIEGRQEFISPGKLDKTTSVASWIEIKRSVIDLKPGQSIQIPLKIQINQYAKVGKYFAQIAFGNGPNRVAAEEQSLSLNVPKVIVNIEVGEQIIEKSQIQWFQTTKNVYLQKPIVFTLDLENSGNREILPQGSIFIYNRRGQEIEKIEFNGNGEKMAPGEKKRFINQWENVSGFGKFKAKVEIEYGETIERYLNESLYFWLLPWSILLGFVFGVVFLITFLTIILFRKTYRPQYSPDKAEGVNGVLDLKGKK